MTYQKHTLENGLRLITVPMPSVTSVTVMILVGVGSRYETEQTNGVTHFLEHMLFKGTKKRPSALALSEVIDGIGGEWNASTGKESTTYYIKAGADNLRNAFDILCDMVKNPLLDKNEIEREKNVIASEIAMYEDTPIRRVGELFEALLYPNSSLGWDITGTRQTVANISREDFLELCGRFYRPENMVVAVSGGIKEKEALRLTKKHLGKLKKGTGHWASGTKETFVQEEPRVLVHKKKTDQAHLVLGFRGNPRGHPDRYAEEVLSAILGGGMSSRLWIAVRERRGLAYYVRAEAEHYEDNGYLSIYAGVDPRKIEQAVKVMLEELGSGEWEVGSKELNKAKEFVKGHLRLFMEDTRNVAGFFGGFELLENKVLTVFEITASIDKVTVEDVARVAKEFFVPERLNLAVIGPYKDGEKFRKMLQLGK